MLDATGTPQSALVLGAGSEIATAVLHRLAAGGRLQRVVLAARRPEAAADLAASLGWAGVGAVEVVEFDARRPDRHADLVDRAFAGGEVDLVLVAAGVLAPTQVFEHDPALAAEHATVNFGGLMSATVAAADNLRRQGAGTVVVLSSVAAERARGDAYVYGATKAGLDAFAQGLGDALQGSGVRVVVVRPGFVRTAMTDGLDPPPIGVTTPARVAHDVTIALASGAEVVWSPGYLRPLFAVLRHLPRGLWRRVSRRS